MEILDKMLNNQYKYVLKWMKELDKKFFKELLPSVLIKKTTIMKELSLNKWKKTKKTCEKNSYFLAKESFKLLPEKIEKRCLGLLWDITNEEYICIDEVDIAKPTAKKMEDLRKIRDSSNSKIVNGYMYHGVSIRNIPVIMEYEDLSNNFKIFYFKKIINKIYKFTKWKWTYLLDAGYDIASYIEFLNSKKITYIIRAKKNRWFTDTDNNKKKLKDFKDWIHKVFIKDVKIPVFLHIKTNSKFPEPMRVLSNSEKINVKEYKKRWEIETIFKSMKQEFKLEKIQAQNLQVFRNIVAIVQLAVSLTSSTYNITQKFKWTKLFQCTNSFTRKFAKYAKHQALTMNKNSIIWFISKIIENMYKWRKKYKWKIATKKSKIPAQLSLFSIVETEKTGEI